MCWLMFYSNDVKVMFAHSRESPRGEDNMRGSGQKESRATSNSFGSVNMQRAHRTQNVSLNRVLHTHRLQVMRYKIYGCARSLCIVCLIICKAAAYFEEESPINVGMRCSFIRTIGATMCCGNNILQCACSLRAYSPSQYGLQGREPSRWLHTVGNTKGQGN